MGMFGGGGLPFFYKTFPAFEQKNGKLAGQVRYLTHEVHVHLFTNHLRIRNETHFATHLRRVSRFTSLLENMESS